MVAAAKSMRDRIQDFFLPILSTMNPAGKIAKGYVMEEAKDINAHCSSVIPISSTV